MHQSRLSMKLHPLRRGYATLRETGDNIPDPCLARWPASPRCTPYDILEQGRHARYCKRRFYELVKVYHPDRWQHATYHGIGKHTRVERYRLIVAANAILSDPARRKAYDERGVGWDRDLVSESTCRTDDAHHGKRQGGSRGTGDASRNATWEDWEQWRSQQAPEGRQKQSAVFICNRSFALILVLFMVVGGCAQLVRADHVARRVAGRQDQVHGALCEELLEIKSRSAGLSDRRLLVDAFLRRSMGARCEGVGG